jgi:hypothetical protein
MTQSDAIASLSSNQECGPPTAAGRTTFRLAQLATTRVPGRLSLLARVYL